MVTCLGAVVAYPRPPLAVESFGSIWLAAANDRWNDILVFAGQRRGEQDVVELVIAIIGLCLTVILSLLLVVVIVSYTQSK